MSEDIHDRRHYEPRSARELMTEFLGWVVVRGTDQLWYAKGPSVLKGEDLLDLRDQLIKWTRQHNPDR